MCACAQELIIGLFGFALIATRSLLDAGLFYEAGEFSIC
jgi:hypothetical protein